MKDQKHNQQEAFCSASARGVHQNGSGLGDVDAHFSIRATNAHASTSSVTNQNPHTHTHKMTTVNSLPLLSRLSGMKPKPQRRLQDEPNPDTEPKHD